jgi:hypothetical protein
VRDEGRSRAYPRGDGRCLDAGMAAPNDDDVEGRLGH